MQLFNLEYILFFCVLFKNCNIYILNFFKYIYKWGLGIGDWGLGIGDWAQSPIPNPQSPIPNPQSPLNHIIYNMNIKNYFNK